MGQCSNNIGQLSKSRMLVVGLSQYEHDMWQHLKEEESIIVRIEGHVW